MFILAALPAMLRVVLLADAVLSETAVCSDHQYGFRATRYLLDPASVLARADVVEQQTMGFLETLEAAENQINLWLTSLETELEMRNPISGAGLLWEIHSFDDDTFLQKNVWPRLELTPEDFQDLGLSRVAQFYWKMSGQLITNDGGRAQFRIEDLTGDLQIRVNTTSVLESLVDPAMVSYVESNVFELRSGEPVPIEFISLGTYRLTSFKAVLFMNDQEYPITSWNLFPARAGSTVCAEPGRIYEATCETSFEDMAGGSTTILAESLVRCPINCPSMTIRGIEQCIHPGSSICGAAKKQGLLPSITPSLVQPHLVKYDTAAMEGSKSDFGVSPGSDRCGIVDAGSMVRTANPYKVQSVELEHLGDTDGASLDMLYLSKTFRLTDSEDIIVPSYGFSGKRITGVKLICEEDMLKKATHMSRGSQFGLSVEDSSAARPVYPVLRSIYLASTDQAEKYLPQGLSLRRLSGYSDPTKNWSKQTCVLPSGELSLYTEWVTDDNEASAPLPSGLIDCTTTFGELYSSRLSQGSLTVLCPQSCNKVDGPVCGFKSYVSTSSICRSGIHAGVIGTAGGPITIVPIFSPPNIDLFRSVTQNDIPLDCPPSQSSVHLPVYYVEVRRGLNCYTTPESASDEIEFPGEEEEVNDVASDETREIEEVDPEGALTFLSVSETQLNSLAFLQGEAVTAHGNLTLLEDRSSRWKRSMDSVLREQASSIQVLEKSQPSFLPEFRGLELDPLSDGKKLHQKWSVWDNSGISNGPSDWELQSSEAAGFYLLQSSPISNPDPYMFGTALIFKHHVMSEVFVEATVLVSEGLLGTFGFILFYTDPSTYFSVAIRAEDEQWHAEVHEITKGLTRTVGESSCDFNVPSSAFKLSATVAFGKLTVTVPSCKQEYKLQQFMRLREDQQLRLPSRGFFGLFTNGVSQPVKISKLRIAPTEKHLESGRSELALATVKSPETPVLVESVDVEHEALNTGDYSSQDQTTTSDCLTSLPADAASELWVYPAAGTWATSAEMGTTGTAPSSGPTNLILRRPVCEGGCVKFSTSMQVPDKSEAGILIDYFDPSDWRMVTIDRSAKARIWILESTAEGIAVPDDQFDLGSASNAANQYAIADNWFELEVSKCEGYLEVKVRGSTAIRKRDRARRGRVWSDGETPKLSTVGLAVLKGSASWKQFSISVE